MSDSTEGFAQAQLRSYVDRVLNVLAEIDALGDDKKAIYKELADDGFDRSVVSQLVGHLRKKAKKPGKFAEQSQLFDLYLRAYEGNDEGGDADDGETGTVPANAHAAREEDAEARRRRRFTESMEDTIALSAQAVRDGLIAPEAHDETVRLSRALAAKFGNAFVDPDADGVVDHFTNSALAASNSNADAPVPSGAAKEVSPDASFANSREDFADATTQGGDGFLTTSLDRAEGDVDGQPLSPQPSEAGLPVAAAAGDNHPDYSSDVTPEAVEQMRQKAAPVLAAMGPLEVVETVSLGSAADKSAGGEVSLAPAAPTKLKMNAEFFDEPHPACRKGKFCGGNSNIALCPECKAAAGLGAETDIEQRESVH